VTPAFPFDYSKFKDVPEVVVRVDLLRERLAQNVKESHPRILEIGVGSGDITLMLAERFSEATCVEIQDANCRLVQKGLKKQN
jgi:16S rRNA A1518/A1519 N6-dimethyltransferase RsmA/KsgA/DIM1 with predicted DNA glycosylase/AP lyase activity